MAQQMTKEELAQKRLDAANRQRIKKLFSGVPEARVDAIDALKDAWGFGLPSFDPAELALNPQAATLMAARRDGIKELITWLSKV